MHSRKLFRSQRLKGEGLEVLLDKVIRALPQNPPYFPEDQLTDQPERFLASEIIREKVLLQTGKEVPYATAVIVERFEDKPRLLRIAAAIFCERDSQKAILIGKGGQKLKQMGTSARMELEKRFGKKVYLELFVKVKPAGASPPRLLKSWIGEGNWKTWLARRG